MTLVALALVLAAAVCHAVWNLLAKRAGGGAAFVWLFEALALVLYAPLAVAVAVAERPRLGAAELLFVGGSGLLHLVYFLLLQRGYRTGDLSLVYPLARGTGPALATAAAIALFGERPAPLAVAGAALIAASAFLIAGGAGGRGAAGASGRSGGAVGYGLLTGATIAAYTLWDKHAVAELLVSPALMYWGANLVQAAILTPVAVRRWPEVRAHWRRHRRDALGVAALSPLAYILVLTALVSAPVSYVAPAREVSILIGAALGARLLAEGHAARRLAAAGGMVVGIVALAVG